MLHNIHVWNGLHKVKGANDRKKSDFETRFAIASLFENLVLPRQATDRRIENSQQRGERTQASGRVYTSDPAALPLAYQTATWTTRG